MELSAQEKVLFAMVENDSTMKQEYNIIKFLRLKDSENLLKKKSHIPFLSSKKVINYL